MITSIKIKNFQIHEDFEADIGPITTFVGSSDTGKSAVLRALRWVVENSPSGTAHIRDGADIASVGVVVDGMTVARERGKSSNTYERGEMEYKAFGNNVPDAIAEVFQTSPVSFQGQHDAPFWFAESPGQVSKNLNEIIDLQIIDDSLSAVNVVVRKHEGLRSAAESRLIDAQKEFDELNWVKSAAKSWDKLKAAEVRSGLYTRTEKFLRGYVADGERYLNAIKKHDRQATDINEAITLVSEIREREKRITRIGSIITAIEFQADKAENECQEIAEIKTKLSEIKVCPTCDRPIQ